MFLHEEYFRRQQINIRLCCRARRAIVLLASDKDRSNWSILNSRWKPPTEHPGFFELTLSGFASNGYQKSELMTHIYEFKECHADLYERELFFLRKLIRDAGFRAVECCEQRLVIWDIFLSLCESWLAENMDDLFFRFSEIAKTISLPVHDRIIASEWAMKLISDEEIGNIWNQEMIPISQSQSDWLVRLINDD
jgi:hypothetical protein